MLPVLPTHRDPKVKKKAWRPFLESSGNFPGPKSNIQNKSAGPG